MKKIMIAAAISFSVVLPWHTADSRADADVSLATTAGSDSVPSVVMWPDPDSIRYHALALGNEPMCPLIRVPAGRYVMGDPLAGRGRVQVPVILNRDYYLGQCEITNLEFVTMLQWALDSGYVKACSYWAVDWIGGEQTKLVHFDTSWSEIGFNDGRFRLNEAPSPHAGNAFPDGYDPASHPVKQVTWEGAAAFCDWLNLCAGLPLAYDHATWSAADSSLYLAAGYRLPADAEWERAARFDDGRFYPWGDEACDCSRANNDRSCVGWTTPVGSYEGGPEISGHRFADLAGNLWEWVHDWWDEVPPAVTRLDPTGPLDGAWRILRGGGWWGHAQDPRCAMRHRFPPDYKGGHVGFRIARTAGPRPDIALDDKARHRWH